MRIWLATASCLALAAPVLAQQPSAEAPLSAEGDKVALAEPEVSAQHRMEPVQLVPLAVTALTARDLEARHLQSTQAVANQVPLVFATSALGAASFNSIFIRGLGSTDSLASVDPPVGLYLDGIYLARQNLNQLGFLAVDRVEVLAGPQGTLFGRNITGGAVNVVMTEPARKLTGFGEFRWGAYDLIGVRGAIDLPMSEGIGIQISGYTQNDDGYVSDRTTGRRLNDSDGSGLRLAARFDLAANFHWRTAVTIINNNGEALPNFRCNPAQPTDCSRRFATTGVPESNAGFGSLGVTGAKADLALGNRSRLTLWSSNLEWGDDDLRVTAITGVADTSQDYALDFADGRTFPSVADPRPAVRGFPFGGYTLLSQSRQRQFSQEVRATGQAFGGALRYVAGAYFFNESARTDFADVATGANAVPRLLADRKLYTSTRSTALYGQADLMLAGNVQLTAGLRWTDEAKRFDIADNRAQCQDSSAVTCLNTASLVAPNGRAIPTRQSVNDLSPRFALTWLPSDHLTLYGSATRGFRSGGWNARGLTADTLLPFGREQAWTYEAGLRSDWFGQRLRVNLTGFILDVDDLQTPTGYVSETGALTFVTQNYASLNNYGLSAEIAAVPVPGLNLWVNAGWQNARYHARADGVNGAGLISVAEQQTLCRAQLAAGLVPLLRGARGAPDCARGIVAANGELARPLRTPRFTVAAGVSYDWALPAAGILLTPDVNVLWRSAYETGTAGETLYDVALTAGGIAYPANPFGTGNVITGSHVASAALVNAGLALRTDDGNWTLAIECFNCLDAAFAESQLGLYTYLTPPRSWQLRLKRVF